MEFTLGELRLIQRALLDEFNVLNDLIDTVGIPIVAKRYVILL